VLDERVEAEASAEQGGDDLAEAVIPLARAGRRQRRRDLDVRAVVPLERVVCSKYGKIARDRGAPRSGLTGSGVPPGCEGSLRASGARRRPPPMTSFRAWRRVLGRGTDGHAIPHSVADADGGGGGGVRGGRLIRATPAPQRPARHPPDSARRSCRSRSTGGS